MIVHQCHPNRAGALLIHNHPPTASEQRLRLW